MTINLTQARRVHAIKTRVEVLPENKVMCGRPHKRGRGVQCYEGGVSVTGIIKYT